MLTYHILKLACWMNQLLNCQLTFCALNVNFVPFVTFAIKEIFNSQSNFRNYVLFHPEPTNFFYLHTVRGVQRSIVETESKAKSKFCNKLKILWRLSNYITFELSGLIWPHLTFFYFRKKIVLYILLYKLYVIFRNFSRTNLTFSTTKNPKSGSGCLACLFYLSRASSGRTKP